MDESIKTLCTLFHSSRIFFPILLHKLHGVLHKVVLLRGERLYSQPHTTQPSVLLFGVMDMVTLLTSEAMAYFIPALVNRIKLVLQ